MERGRLCFWGPSKGSSRYDVFATWKERAFAADPAGDLGSVWPPRSYTCSFCGREFRSAQALGGHMNVHRRDRARLKLSQTSLGGEKMQIAPDLHDKDGSLTSSLIPSCVDLDRGAVPRVLSRSLPSYKRTNVLGCQLFPSSPYWSPLGRKQEENKGCRFLRSRSLVYPTIVEARKNISDTTNGDKLQCIEDNRMLARLQARSKYFIEETTILKRAKISDSHTLPRFTFDRFFTEDCSHKSEASRVKVGPWEELDLELRLGSPPKVK